MFRLQDVISKDLSIRSFVTAGAMMAVAVAIRAALDPALPDTPPFITLYLAVALAALLCGPLATACAGLLSLIAAIYLWIPPRHSLATPSLTNCIAIAIFCATSAIILWAAAAMRAQLNAVSVANHALDLGLSAGEIGTWEINLRTQRIKASAASRRLHGLPEDLTKTTTPDDWIRGVHPDDAAAARAVLQTAVVECGHWPVTYRVIDAPGGPRWISARGRVVSSGGDRHLLCALVDITDQVTAQDALKLERERLRLALQAGALAVWDYDLETRDAVIDTQYATTMGFEPGVKTLTQADIGARIHPEDLPKVGNGHDTLIASGGDYRIDYRILTPSGETRWLLSQGILVKENGQASPGRLVGIIQDITDQKRRENDLRDLASLREILIREADHRIKNSLHMVISFLTLQLRGIEDAAAADALRGAITRVGAIAASHLALQGSDDLRQLDLIVALRDLCAHFALLHPQITIECRAAGSVILDADRAIPLAMTVSELLTNALRHAFPGQQTGRVVVEAGVEKTRLILRVSDDGVGIAPSAVGNGLGSRIIRSLLAQLDAAIEIDSTLEGGTTVTLRLSPAATTTACRYPGVSEDFDGASATERD